MQIERLLEYFSRVEESGTGWTARCPAHDDSNNSLSISPGDDGRTLVHCFAGCQTLDILTMLELHWADLSSAEGSAGCDLKSYAEDKRLDVEWLAQEFGLEDTSYSVAGQMRPAVAIPYVDQSGSPVATRYRIDLQGKDRFRWAKGSKAKGLMYGLWKLDEIKERGFVVIVEGESDCQSAWANDVPALGIPGANNWDEANCPMLDNVPVIYLVKEPDKGGETLLAALRKSGIRDRVRVVHLSRLEFKDLNEMHADDPSLFRDRWRQAIDSYSEKLAEEPLTAIISPRPRVHRSPVIFGADELMGKDFPEPRWAIEGILPEGLTILGGKPKVGKSWICLGLGVAVSTGGMALGAIPVEQGVVLYLALEDSERRVQERLKSVLRGSDPPLDLKFATEWPMLANGGLSLLSEWLEEHPECKLVIVDTLQKVRAPARNGANAYADDYAVLSPIKDLADAHRVPIMVVHHLRKLTADDPLDQFSGTTGLTGAADTLISLSREKETVDAVLYVRGRDVEERELALAFDKPLTSWVLVGNSEDFAKTHKRSKVVALATDKGIIIAADVAESLAISKDAARQLLGRMVNDEELQRVGSGKYSVPHKLKSVTSQGHTSYETPEDRDAVTGVTQAVRIMAKPMVTLPDSVFPPVSSPMSSDEAIGFLERLYGTR